VVWKDVMDLNENIPVDYSTVEELFASKTIQPKETEKKKPTEVFLCPIHYKNLQMLYLRRAMYKL